MITPSADPVRAICEITDPPYGSILKPHMKKHGVALRNLLRNYMILKKTKLL